MKLNKDQIRQGDVLLVRVGEAEVPRWAIEAGRDEHGRVVAEYGEATGHAHAIRDKDCAGFRAETAEAAALAGLDVVLVGGAGAVMRHECPDGRHAEHAPVTLRAGVWERAVQVEYDPGEERRIAD